MPRVEKAPPAAMLEEVKAYLRLEDGREDALLSGLLRAATEAVEALLGRLLLEREVEEVALVRAGVLELALEPVTGLVALHAVADDGSESPLAGRLVPERHGRGRVAVDVADGATVRVRYRAGLALDWNGVPEVLRLAVVRAAAHFHAVRDAGDGPGMPPSVRRMLAPWRARMLR